MSSTKTLSGPFAQILTMSDLPAMGAISDDQIRIITDGGILSAGPSIVEVASFETLRKKHKDARIETITEKAVVLPGLIDCHTHICFAGSRAQDYALRVAGKSYLEIAKAGGGILDTMRQTRTASQQELETLLLKRCGELLSRGVTTCEVKSGYGLCVDEELKILQAISHADKKSKIDLVSTCLAAHTCPPEFSDNRSYLGEVVKKLLPQVKNRQLSRRVDIFVEDSAFTEEEALWYLSEAKKLGFEITVHADQMTTGGSNVAARMGAMSADHLEISNTKELKALKAANVIAVALPGASLGLGTKFAPARKILNEGLTLAIASDWNPGSAPMGDLLTQAALLGAAEKLTAAETLAGITIRAARALSLSDCGALASGRRADFIAFPADDYREILYQQGRMRPVKVWKNGETVL